MNRIAHSRIVIEHGWIIQIRSDTNNANQWDSTGMLTSLIRENQSEAMSCLSDFTRKYVEVSARFLTDWLYERVRASRAMGVIDIWCVRIEDSHRRMQEIHRLRRKCIDTSLLIGASTIQMTTLSKDRSQHVLSSLCLCKSAFLKFIFLTFGTLQKRDTIGWALDRQATFALSTSLSTTHSFDVKPYTLEWKNVPRNYPCYSNMRYANESDRIIMDIISSAKQPYNQQTTLNIMQAMRYSSLLTPSICVVRVKKSLASKSY